jgi:hypothetical protein
MEYDYAIAQKKPAIGFVHADPGSIIGSKLETSEDARAKLQKFIEKIKRRPVRGFRSAYELAQEVTTSFVRLIRERPAVGYVRSDSAVDFKRYSEVLEENKKLKEALGAAESTAPFSAHEKPIELLIVAGQWAGGTLQGPRVIEVRECSLMEGFRAVAEGTLRYAEEKDVLNHAAKSLLEPTTIKDLFKEAGDYSSRIVCGFDEVCLEDLRRDLVLYGLIQVEHEERSRYTVGHSSITSTVAVWKLTDYGRRQLAAVAP